MPAGVAERKQDIYVILTAEEADILTRPNARLYTAEDREDGMAESLLRAITKVRDDVKRKYFNDGDLG